MNIYKFHTNPESLDFYKEVLTQVPRFAYEHAKSLGRRFPEGEAAISKDAEYAYKYAKYVIEGRWPEGEATITKDVEAAYLYARDAIEGRFPEGETEISKDAEYAYKYARDVVKGRWPAGEATIANSLWKQDYEKIFKVKL
jgi:lambda repressor-like predicted transcriptional regulator